MDVRFTLKIAGAQLGLSGPYFEADMCFVGTSSYNDDELRAVGQALLGVVGSQLPPDMEIVGDEIQVTVDRTTVATPVPDPQE